MNDNRSVLQSIFVWCCILLPILRIVKLIPALPIPVYYGAFALLGMVALSNRKIRIYWLTVLFVIVCFLSILGNNVPTYFHSFERYVGCLFIILSVGPLFYNDWLYQTRIKCINYLSWLAVWVSAVSFILYIIYRPITITERGNLFGGITVHSMTLGPLSALSTLFLIQYIVYHKESLQRKTNILLWCICVFCILACILAGSRAALLSFIVALSVWLWKYMQNIRRFMYHILGIVAIVGMTFPIWWKYTETIQRKVQYAEGQGSFVATRSGKWEARWQEFKESPLIGYGFGSVKMTVNSTNIKNWSGTVEPGNGWLFLLSSTGVFSFLIFASIYGKLLWNLHKRKEQISLLLLVYLIFFGVHMMAEGYILSAGNFFFFYLWLCIGTASDYLQSSQDIEKL